jgi:acetylornithine/succinyldiaminopimelate/putrescine aminotransferase
MTLAKSLCGGIAGGAMLARREVAASLRPGMHAATFGGNPIAARAGIATLETIDDEGLLDNARQLGEFFQQRLEALRQECPAVREVRVLGVMVGVELNVEGAPVVKSCLARRLLVNCTQNVVIRLLPAMNLSIEQAEQGCDILASAVKELSA